MELSLIGSGVGLVVCTYLLYRWWIRSRRRYQLRKEISHEIDDLVNRLGTLTDKTAIARDISGGVLDNVRYLTTLITVMVKKHDGLVRLTEEDFDDCTTDDYISVQYDVNENSLYLVSNRVMPLISDMKADDEPTFH